MRRSASEIIRNLEKRIARLERGKGGVDFLNLDEMQGYSPDQNGVLYCIVNEAYGYLKSGKLFIKDSDEKYIKRFFRSPKQFTKMLKQEFLRYADDKAFGYKMNASGIDSFEEGMWGAYSGDFKKIQSCKVSVEEVESPSTGELGYLVKVNNGRGI